MICQLWLVFLVVTIMGNLTFNYVVVILHFYTDDYDGEKDAHGDFMIKLIIINIVLFLFCTTYCLHCKSTL